ncbi:type III glutamate--ammonia ligase [Sulfobacillus thermosulfidooxidans]|uniref:type III glutamate--ammonia ligase n=1 Tax=Sulfobacillus thermosulfidooxidans TaxID=28034 RepID=UPI0006B5006F|nr:type III glutamate--ammonia ligase [Sulfobacillus thermosulfidooxidans]
MFQNVFESSVQQIILSFVDLHGILRAKLVPKSHLAALRETGAGFAGFAIGSVGQGPHDPDLTVRPDLSRWIPLKDMPDTAWTIGNLMLNDQPWHFCTRNLLEKVCDDFRHQALQAKVGIEAEFYLVREIDPGHIVPADDYDRFPKTCYQLDVLGRHLPFLTKVIEGLEATGIDVYQVDHEDGPSQFEINWVYDDALVTADRFSFLKFWVKRVAQQEGLIATFMPKPFSSLTGSGAHVHLSLWDTQTNRNLFDDPHDPWGLSSMAHHFIAGIVSHAAALTAFVAPTVNSYKRLSSPTSLSGATWSPTTITVGANNRTHLIRVPGPGRLEFRAMDAAANPYLGVAALLVAGLDGIQRQLPKLEPSKDNMYDLDPADILHRQIARLPSSLDRALDALEADPLFADAFGSTFVQGFLAYKRAEWDEYHQTVSPQEIQRYLLQ